LTDSRNGQGGRLCDLFQVVAGDAAAEEDDPRLDGHRDAAQRPVTGGAEPALDAFGQVEVLLALRREQARPPASVSSPVRWGAGRVNRAADLAMDHSSFSADESLRLPLLRVGISPAILERRFGTPSAARRLNRPRGEFGPQDANLIVGLESEPHPVPSDLDHGYGDVVADDDLLAGLSVENQHVTSP
jgi:hypothetical protein